MEAYHLSHSDSHVGIRGKVEVYLKHIEKHSEPQAECRAAFKNGKVLLQVGGNGKRRIRKQNSVRKRAADVCKQRLFTESGRKARNSL